MTKIRYLVPVLVSILNPMNTHGGFLIKDDTEEVYDFLDRNSLPVLKSMAENNQAYAQFQLGAYYYELKDYSNAFKWSKRSADQGNKYAQFNIGIMYHKGKGVPQNDELAITYLVTSAANGFEKAFAVLKELSVEELKNSPRRFIYTPNGCLVISSAK